MRIITSLMSCLMTLAGCHEKPSVTHITRTSGGDAGVIFSKATQVDGVATFQCFESDSGRCHYLIYAERCPTAAPGENPNCKRETLDQFALAPGDRREVHGLPSSFRLCVDRREISAAASGCGA
jgi:hypothetical protein